MPGLRGFLLCATGPTCCKSGSPNIGKKSLNAAQMKSDAQHKCDRLMNLSVKTNMAPNIQFITWQVYLSFRLHKLQK